jgi:hypothetical protein
MEYKLLRKQFCELSGRLDLINEDLTDNGADFFINAGQRFLDNLCDIGKMEAKSVQSIAAGTIIVKCLDLRSVKEVRAGNSTDGLFSLDKTTVTALKNYYEKQLSSVDRGDPAFYAPCHYRPAPDAQLATGWSGYYDIDDLLLDSSHFLYNGIIISPPPNKTWYISVSGLFYSPTLSATLVATTGVWTQSKSVWAEFSPDVLITAALYKLEVFYRNTEGMKDFLSALKLDVTGIDNVEAEEAGNTINQMRG